MSLMEKGLGWISLFIAIAPSLGFLGTVIGMIQAFDAIQAAGDISPNVVAGGMKVALITTVRRHDGQVQQVIHNEPDNPSKNGKSVIRKNFQMG